MLKCIITGLGNQGRYWTGNIAKRDDCKAVAFVEPLEANRVLAVEKLGLDANKIFYSFEEAINAVEADFIVDVTPPAVHHVIAKQAFEAGLHVIGEKPLSDDYQTAKDVVEAGERAGVKHMITQNYRFTDQPRTTRKVIEEGLIGAPEQADVKFYMNWADKPGSHYVTEPFMLINDMMVHHFDLLRYVLDADPESVRAMTWNQSWGWHQGDAAHAIVFRFPGNVMATHIACACAVGSRTSYNGDWRIEGPKGSLDWRSDGSVNYAHLHRVEEPVEYSVPLLDVPSPDQAMLDEFFAAIREDRAPECNARDNLKSLAMVFAAIESAKSGKEVSLSEF